MSLVSLMRAFRLKETMRIQAANWKAATKLQMKARLSTWLFGEPFWPVWPTIVVHRIRVMRSLGRLMQSFCLGSSMLWTWPLQPATANLEPESFGMSGLVLRSIS